MRQSARGPIQKCVRINPKTHQKPKAWRCEELRHEESFPQAPCLHYLYLEMGPLASECPIHSADGRQKKTVYPIQMRTDFGWKVLYGNAEIGRFRIGHLTVYALGLHNHITSRPLEQLAANIWVIIHFCVLLRVFSKSGDLNIPVLCNGQTALRYAISNRR